MRKIFIISAFVLVLLGGISVYVRTPHVPLTAQVSSGQNYILTPWDKIPNFCVTPTKTAAQSGNWSNPAIWSPSGVPGSSDVVEIPQGITVTYDVGAGANGGADCIGVYGTLRASRTVPTSLKVGNLLIYNDPNAGRGTLDWGTVSSPIPASIVADIQIADRPLETGTVANPGRDPAQIGTAILGFGNVYMHGAIKTPYVKLANEPQAGATSLSLSQPVSGWMVGDRITVPSSTSRVRSPDAGTITSISPDGLTIGITPALTYTHIGGRDKNGVLEFLPYITNISRNVVVRSENPAGTRGHTLFTYRADVDIRYSEFDDLGRTNGQVADSTRFDANGNPTYIGTNQIGRYGPHAHHLMGLPPGQTPANGYQFTLIGNAMANLATQAENIKSIWGITIHDSHYGLVNKNVVYNLGGAGIVSAEQGNESYNVISENFVDRITTLNSNRDSESFGVARNGAGIWGAAGNNYVFQNIVANAWTYGYSVFIEFTNFENIPNFKGANTSIPAEVTMKNMKALAWPKFDDNMVYGSVRNSMTFWQPGASNALAWDSIGTVIKNFTVWNSGGVFCYPNGNLKFINLVHLGGPGGSGDGGTSGAFGCGDYASNNMLLENPRVENVVNNGHMASNVGGIQVIEGGAIDGTTSIMTFSNNLSGQPCDSLDRPDGSLPPMMPRQMFVDGVQLTQPGGIGYNFAVHQEGGSCLNVGSYAAPDRLFWLDANADGDYSDSYKIFSLMQMPDAIMQQTNHSLGIPRYEGCPVAGLTNQQCFDQYGVATLGEIAGNGCAGPLTLDPKIKDGIKCLVNVPQSVISNIQVTHTGPTVAVVSWTTDIPATSRVDYGPTTAYGTIADRDAGTKNPNKAKTAHQIILRNLTPGTLYHYKVQGRSETGRKTVSSDFTFQTPPETANLLNHWRMDEKDWKYVVDYGSKPVPGIHVAKPIAISGRFGSAYFFNNKNFFPQVPRVDGQDNSIFMQYVETPKVSTPTSFPYSISAWVKYDTASTYTETIFSNYFMSTDFIDLQKTPGGRLAYAIKNPGNSQGNVFIETPSSYADGHWHHVVGYSANNQSHALYVDGQLVGTSTTAVTFISWPNTTTIGGRPNGTQDPYSTFRGMIDDVRVYDKVLSAGEILGLYNATPSPAGPNSAPIVDAGDPQTISLSDSPSMEGSVLDDDLPVNPGTTTVQWSKISGPGRVAFRNAADPKTDVGFEVEGTYVLQLWATDGELASTDTVTFTVTALVGQLPSKKNLASLFTPNADAAGPPSAAVYELNFEGNVNDASQNTSPVMQGGGASFINGPFGQAINLTGGRTVRIPHIAKFNSSENTVCTYVKVPMNRGSYYLYSKFGRNNGTGNGKYKILSENYSVGGYNGRELGFANRETERIPMDFAQANYPTDLQWHHVCLTVGRNPKGDSPILAKQYIDGDAVIQSKISGVASQDSWDALLGGIESNTSDQALDNSCFFNRALTHWEVESLKAGGSCTALPPDLQLYLLSLGGSNLTPRVFAGLDQNLAVLVANLAGSASDDGLPNPPGTLTTTWSQISGQGIVTFGNVNAPVTTATFSTAGTYVLRLTASDSVLSAFDEVTITVSAASSSSSASSAPANQAPVVNAGNDQTITLPSVADLDGTVTDDGLPNPPGAVITTWSHVSGGGTVTFGNPNAVDTTASFSTAGTYVLRLTADDSALTTSDQVTITVNPAPASSSASSAASSQSSAGGAHTLVVDIPFTGNSAQDLSGYGNHGTLMNGAQFVAGRVGEGVHMSAAQMGMVRIPHAPSLDLGTQFTVAGWFQNDRPPTEPHDTMFSKVFDWQDADGWMIATGWNGTVIPFGGSTQNYETRWAPWEDHGWHHFAAVYNGNTVKIYGDGVFTGQATIDPPLNNTKSLHLGGGGGNGWEGKVDEVRVWQGPLTDQEILDEYNRAGSPSSSSASSSQGSSAASSAQSSSNSSTSGGGGIPARLAEWNFEESPGSTVVQDTSGHGYNGLLSGGASRTANGRRGSALLLNGAANQFADMSAHATALDAASPATVSFWVNTQVDTSAIAFQASQSTDIIGHAYFISLGDGSTGFLTNELITLASNRDGINSYYRIGHETTQRSKLYDGAWHHVAITYGRQADIYLDGVALGITEGTGINNGTFADVGNVDIIRLGAQLTGAMDEFCMWTQTLTVQQVQEVMNYGCAGNTGGTSSQSSSSSSTTPNQPPVVSAGTDQVITLPASASLDGTVTDDGLPNPPGAITSLWTMVSGPGIVTFGNASLVDTTASFSVAGTYVLRLAATDSDLTDFDDITIQVRPQNQPPVVSAGTDQTITLPASATLSGTATDDGLPNPPGTLTTTWGTVSGPGVVTFGNPNALSTTATFTLPGTYIIRLTGDDSDLRASDDVTVVVRPQNQAPVVDAGPDLSTTFPADVDLDATVTDDGFPIPPGSVSTLWSKVSGPGVVTFVNASAVDTTVSFSAPGSYVLRLSANDGALSDTDTVTVLINPDTTPPVITNIQADPTVSSATITWQTDEPATSQVEYGRTAAYGSTTPEDPILVKNHTVVLTGLTPGALYHFRVLSKDSSGNRAASGDNTVQLLTPPPLDIQICLGKMDDRSTRSSGKVLIQISNEQTGVIVYSDFAASNAAGVLVLNNILFTQFTGPIYSVGVTPIGYLRRTTQHVDVAGLQGKACGLSTQPFFGWDLDWDNAVTATDFTIALNHRQNKATNEALLMYFGRVPDSVLATIIRNTRKALKGDSL